MKPYSKLTKEELKKLKGQLEKQFEEVKAKGIHLDMSRGKPSKAQLDLSNGHQSAPHILLHQQISLSIRTIFHL